MPLILIVGRPSSGKTRRALKLKEYIETELSQEVVILNEEMLKMNRNECYSDNIKEKEMRGYFKTEVERLLTSKTVVILDTLNYIKGFRYELYCLARTAKSTNCVVYCETPIEIARQWNEKREDNNYSQELFDDLWKRMEEPNNKSRVRLRIDRWDSPLFIVNFEQDIPLKDVVQAALFDPKKAKDPISTKQDLLKTGNFVHDLDKTLQRILDVIIERQNSMMLLNGGVERVMLEVSFGEAEAKLRLKRMVPVGQLKQFKADFLKMNKQNPFLNLDKVTSAFIGYIQSFEDDY